jgi:hypothetical protein
MGTEQKTPASSSQPSAGASRPSPVLVDLGKKSPKAVRKLRKGKGKLMDSVAATVQELQSSGQIGANAQPVIIVVTEKSESLYRLWKM